MGLGLLSVYGAFYLFEALGKNSHVAHRNNCQAQMDAVGDLKPDIVALQEVTTKTVPMLEKALRRKTHAPSMHPRQGTA